MALPHREYFYLEEVAKRWSVSLLDIQYYVENGVLEARVWLRNIVVELGNYENSPDGKDYPVPHDVKPVSGLYALWPEDCRMLFRKGKVVLNHLRCHNSDEYCKIINDEGLKIKPCDLLITAEACLEFEKQNGIYPDEIVCLANDNTGFKYYNNFKEVSLNGNRFQLGPLQANVVKILHEAHLNGTPWVYGKEALRSSNAETMRMVDLFKRKDNWRELILSDGKGSYCLNIMQQE
ncbi:MAG: hypothetical protein K0R98_720 [Rickettsiaceae bacterium]|jgi:hypothetical protein|nr:hypothetical protein [Rickettsiaceae bacterium]